MSAIKQREWGNATLLLHQVRIKQPNQAFMQMFSECWEREQNWQHIIWFDLMDKTLQLQCLCCISNKPKAFLQVVLILWYKTNVCLVICKVPKALEQEAFLANPMLFLLSMTLQCNKSSWATMPLFFIAVNVYTFLTTARFYVF